MQTARPAIAHYIPLIRGSWSVMSLGRRLYYMPIAVTQIYELHTQVFLWKSEKNDVSSLFMPVKVLRNADDISVGEELSSKLKKEDILKILNQFHKRPQIRKLSEENGLDNRLFEQAFISFRKFCMDSENLPTDLHIIVSDVIHGSGHVDDIVPFFLKHAHQVFPHLECMEELKKISDLRLPANWYPEARSIIRKIIFHAGPTNSGKTYHALERFITAESGIYCSPLKLLAGEVQEKTNSRGTPCDLVTGEERKNANPDGTPARHIACTVEMAPTNIPYKVAVIDEIQMIRDFGRGWAWTRALLGLVAEEIHICGEAAALNLIKQMVNEVGEEMEIRRYERLTKLTIEDGALGSLDNVEQGDCIVCFSKNDIFSISLQLERRGHKCAVIYGALPPGTKLAQANKFNDPLNPCKILVSTDAIGMGLNLSIRRIIFYSVMKPSMNEKGEKEMDNLTTSQALQIAGRAGRYGTQFDEGFVTTFHAEDLPVLKEIMSRPVQPITAAGLHPTADQIELFAYNLPHATLANLIDIFLSLSQVNTASYFMCNIEDFKFLADMIQHVQLPLRARYVFCCAPINRKIPFVCSMFLKFARQYSHNDLLTFEWLKTSIGWPFNPPQTIMDLVHLEAVFDVLDLYLWLSYRFLDLFPDAEHVRMIQRELDKIIQEGVYSITSLLQTGEFEKDQVVTEEQQLSGHNEDIRNKSRHIRGNDVFVKAASSVSIGKGQLTQQLLDKGLLTHQMLEQLQKEWEEGGNSSGRKIVTKGKKSQRELQSRDVVLK
ncbi:ATP-dependent RNA helicase SUV3 homolog, mitochondrial-like [Limulus polyphemus]|uniref:RNA helicase n=1 Tax=Limulus polyphemus TaxID=6850 RepID=A0ABM1TKT9_LIMPO|nr:ATP-dependent RNA helicase SUV3 homolog, mitochondrial-like [Limulus polyphemus]XP_022256494.1 ATP-dependent RNA helicase SUV3 homolog, mitochondrial-like [Limulus polyphemus]XP_022256495.1 ATP-dependent RNA helicase SUV3 homolog, mitochondrial-like [Limulus polyphemus]XP_022256496.1 ATP-dependent RNA helicase SUV3 homolog, mitochondrial-like [Limulus polyphemus]XP_022256497.1 ATP-dependent RNA helicase SUV3 homolog, mitochondrial-like [Limulus polyphemus]XP_022256498.1 ATP-dependent RNA he